MNKNYSTIIPALPTSIRNTLQKPKSFQFSWIDINTSDNAGHCILGELVSAHGVSRLPKDFSVLGHGCCVIMWNALIPARLT